MKRAYLKIKGGQPLKGEVKVSGAKNAVLPLLFSSLMAQGRHTFTNVPQLTDVSLSLKIFQSLGLSFKRNKDTLVIQNTAGPQGQVCSKSARSFRAGILCLGPLLSLKQSVRLPLPGGCQIGSRPIDLHLDGLKKMGAEIYLEKDFINAKAPKGLKACSFRLKFPSVGATENLIMASVLAKGLTFLDNIACEPEIIQLIDYLKKMGAEIKQVKKRSLKIKGVKSLKPLKTAYPIIPDRIEAGTWLLAGACTRGEVLVKKCRPQDLSSLLKKLELAGFKISKTSDQILLKSGKKHQAVSIKTGVHPSFPTDLQSQFIALMTSLKGQSTLTETIFENRFRYIEQLNLLKANIHVQPASRALIKGPVLLKGSRITATDLRAGAGLILAGLMAKGFTYVYGLEHIERGYENITAKLLGLGANIQLLKSNENKFQ